MTRDFGPYLYLDEPVYMADSTGVEHEGSTEATTMSQHYSDPTRADETYSLPDVETFYRTVEDNKADGWVDDDGDPLPAGWYWWTCLPGCMPDSDPFGPFDTEAEAVEDAQNF